MTHIDNCRLITHKLDRNDNVLEFIEKYQQRALRVEYFLDGGKWHVSIWVSDPYNYGCHTP